MLYIARCEELSKLAISCACEFEIGQRGGLGKVDVDDDDDDDDDDLFSSPV